MGWGTLIGIAGYTLWLKTFYPTYYHDSGSPPLMAAIFIGGPAGMIAGLIYGIVRAIWKSRG